MAERAEGAGGPGGSVGKGHSGAPEEVLAWLHADRLGRVWELIGVALERRGLEARGTLHVRDLDRDERHALSDVLGRPVAGTSVRLGLPDLADRLRTRTGHDLVAVVGWTTGRPLTDHAAVRRASEIRRDEPLLAARAWLASAGLATHDAPGRWVDVWLDNLRRDGILTRSPDAERAILTALEVLDDRGALPAAEAPSAARVVARTELAARVTGSAHGLDDGTKAALVVLRAAAAREGTTLPRRAADRRALWESLGVVVDRVSSTCLTWNLLPGKGTRDGGVGSRDVRAASVPRHVTWWDLDAGLDWAPGQSVLVCENPRTLEAIADAAPVARVGVVCSMGRANLVVREVLTRLRHAGARLRYHGDFDWPGLTLANECVTDFGAVPWLMSVEDYEAGHGSLALGGSPVEAAWDPELSPSMRARGLAVHEEAVLDEVLRRLEEVAAT